MIVITKKTHRLRVTLSDNTRYGEDNYQET